MNTDGNWFSEGADEDGSDRPRATKRPVSLNPQTLLLEGLIDLTRQPFLLLDSDSNSDNWFRSFSPLTDSQDKSKTAKSDSPSLQRTSSDSNMSNSSQNSTQASAPSSQVRYDVFWNLIELLYFKFKMTAVWSIIVEWEMIKIVSLFVSFLEAAFDHELWNLAKYKPQL